MSLDTALVPRHPRGHQRGRSLVASLAVDVEPVVFWDGVAPAPREELERWKRDVGLDEARHGKVSVGHNGPSGEGLVANGLAPLRLDTSAVAFTDAVPWFFVKGGRGSQGGAIASRFAPLAMRLQVEAGSPSLRPSARGMVELAASSERRARLRQEVIEAGAPLAITLGQEALDAMRAVADDTHGGQPRLAPEGYGTVGHLTIDSHRCELLPLVHPGFQRQTTDSRWRHTFEAWPSVASTILA